MSDETDRTAFFMGEILAQGFGATKTRTVLISGAAKSGLSPFL
jgi:hypothetical protein